MIKIIRIAIKFKKMSFTGRDPNIKPNSHFLSHKGNDIQNSMYMNEYERSIKEPEQFWGEIGERVVHWDKPFEKVLDHSNPPFTKWYSGGYINACYNAIDRHVLAGRGSKVALIHDSPMTNTVRHVTYQELLDSVSTLYERMK